MGVGSKSASSVEDPLTVGGVLLGGGKSSRFGTDKLAAEWQGERLLDRACRHFLEAGLAPVVFVGRLQPTDPRVRVAAPGIEMIETLRSGLRMLPPGPFAFAPADMPFLTPSLIRGLKSAFEASGAEFLVPSHGGRRGHPAFARSQTAFTTCKTAREVWGLAGDALHHKLVATADVLYDIDRPVDLAEAGSEESRRRRLLDRGDLGG